MNTYITLRIPIPKRGLRLALAAMLVIALAVSFAPLRPAGATVTFTVTRFDDPAPGLCLPADCSLREAVLDANGTVGDDIIDLPLGTYYLTILPDGTPDDGADGDLDVSDNLSITGTDAAMTVIHQLAPDRVIHVDPLGIGGILLKTSGVSIVGGDTSADGGGIYNNAGTLDLTDTLIVGNYATDSGGGIFNPVSGIVKLTNSFVNNNITTGTGGGIANAGDVTLVDSTVNGNGAYSGGGIYNLGSGSNSLTFIGGMVGYNYATNGGGVWSSGQMSADGTAFNGNRAEYGGAVYNWGSAQLNGSTVTGNWAANAGGGFYNEFGTLSLVDCTVSINRGTNAGGGIHNLSTGTVALTYTTLVANRADGTGGVGGGIANAGYATLMYSTITGNDAQSGGGIYNIGGAGTVDIFGSTLSFNDAGYGGGLWNTGTAVMTNSTSSHNRADLDGGGIYNWGGLLYLNNATLAHNVADFDNNGTGSGGGLHSTPPAPAGVDHVKNTIMAENIDRTGTGPDCSGALDSSAFNLVENPTGCGGLTATDIIGQPALLGPLTDNGGWSWTHALLPGSPAIDGGDPAGCTDQAMTPITNDQRSYTRPIGVNCDIGAYEYNMLANASFDLDFDGDSMPDAWSPSGMMTADDTQDCSKAHFGTCSFKFKGDTTYTDKLKQILTGLSGGAGDTLDLGIWAEGKNVPAAAVVKVQIKLYNAGVKTESFTMVIPAGGTFAFTHFPASFVATAGYDMIKVQIKVYLAGGGSLWVDDITLGIY